MELSSNFVYEKNHQNEHHSPRERHNDRKKTTQSYDWQKRAVQKCVHFEHKSILICIKICLLMATIQLLHYWMKFFAFYCGVMTIVALQSSNCFLMHFYFVEFRINSLWTTIGLNSLMDFFSLFLCVSRAHCIISMVDYWRIKVCELYFRWILMQRCK